MVCGCDQDILSGHEADISPLTWKSHKMNRAGANTLFCECNGLSEGLAHCEWVASWLGLAKSLDYDLRRRGILNREISVRAIMKEPEGDISLAAIIDAKSLYDVANQEQYAGADKRAALEICVIKDSLEQLGGAVRWVPHELNPVDCFTKLKGNAQALISVLRSGKYKLTGEEEELKKRKEYREKTGQRNPRPNQSVSNSWFDVKEVKVDSSFLTRHAKRK